MLVRFSVSNFLSFDKEVTLSMIPGRTRKHPNHIVRDPAWNGIDLLRIALVYGANASGKSNLVKAISFAQNLIIEGTKPKQPIPVKCHKLSKVCSESPTKFEFELKYENAYYIYGFELDLNSIQKEWLYKTTSTTQHKVYERETSNNQEVSVRFGDIKFSDNKERDFLEFVAKGTRSNQLFLTESMQRNVKNFEHIFFWFKNALKIIGHKSEFGQLITPTGANDKIIKHVVSYIKKFDTGISGISVQPSSLDEIFPDLSSRFKDSFASDSGPGATHIVMRGKHFLIKVDNEKRPKVFKLMTKHKIKDTNEDVLFDLGDESDGTQRIIELIPTILKPSSGDQVFIMDELDTSLHPNLSKNIIKEFLQEDSTQMITTTHESTLLDLNLLRRDEIWFTEKDERGATGLYSLEEFAPRYDKDIRKGYLLGRFGAIPVLRGDPQRLLGKS